MDTYLFGCAGIPGAGKSSALKRLDRTGYLREELKILCDRMFGLDNDSMVIDVVFVQEPSKLWRQKGWLQAFYADPSHNAAAFQMLVFDSYIEAVETAIEDNPSGRGRHADFEFARRVVIIVVERTFYCQRLFWEQQVESGCATASGMYRDAYERIWQRWRRFIPEPSMIFFFQTTNIQDTMRRVRSRARAEELHQLSSSEDTLGAKEEDVISSVGGLTLDYQQRLLDKHRTWFTEPIAHPVGEPPEGKGIPCVHVNVDAPYHVDDGALRELAKRMAAHIWGIIKKRG